MAKTKAFEASEERRAKEGRRNGTDRRKENVPVAVERRSSTRRKVARRRQIDPTTCERDYTLDEIEFMHALDAYKRSSGRMFPTCSEILEVIRSLGYARAQTAAASDSPVTSAEASEENPEFAARAESQQADSDEPAIG